MNDFFSPGKQPQTSDVCIKTGNKEEGFTYNCNYKGFTTIPKDFDARTVGISIAHNALRFVSNYTCSYLPKLRWFYLAFNKISTIQPYAFINCTSLTSLDLSRNLLNFTSDSMPVEVFRSLAGLKEFYTSDNRRNKVHAFPSAFCVYLKELIIINIDVFNGFKFPPECKSMQRLQSVTLQAVEALRLKNGTLEGLSGLSIDYFELVGNRHIIQPIEAGFLHPIQNVKKLKMAYTTRRANIASTLRAVLYPLRNKTMEEIHLGKIRDRVAIDLKNEDFHILKTICVKKLRLIADYIIQTNFNTMIGSQLWNCLEELDLSENFDTRFDHSFVFMLTLPRVRKLNICCQHISRDNTYNILSKEQNGTRSIGTYGLATHNIQITIFIPDTLEWFSMAHIDLRRNTFDFDVKLSAINLRYADFSYLLVDSCGGRITGAPSLKTLRIQMWNCEQINTEFITHLTSIEYLTFSSLNLGQNVISKPLLQNLSLLHTLNVSDNAITDLNDHFFKSQENSLKHLDMSYNLLQYIPTSLMSLKRIKYVDLRHNKFHSFSKREMSFITNSDNLTISLEGNILDCSCGAMTVLRWLKENSRNIKDVKVMKCINDKGTLQNVDEIIENLRQIELACVSKFWLYLSTSGIIVLVFILIISTILYKFRADVRYLYARLRRYIVMWKQQYVPLTEKYHAFVSYGSSSYEWTLRTLLENLEGKGFKLCVEDRDFIPGRDMVDNILDSIDNSKRVIFVLTRDFLENDWCEWHIKLARIHAFRNDNENFIIVIIKDDIKSHEIPNSLSRIWVRVNCLRWPYDEDPELIADFWKRLERSLREN